MIGIDRILQVAISGVAAGLFVGAVYLWSARGEAIVLDLANLFCI